MLGPASAAAAAGGGMAVPAPRTSGRSTSCVPRTSSELCRSTGDGDLFDSSALAIVVRPTSRERVQSAEAAARGGGGRPCVGRLMNFRRRLTFRKTCNCVTLICNFISPFLVEEGKTYNHAINNKQESLALASMVRDDPPASSTAAAMRGKVGSEFKT